jgi:valyl-tRNA synthetase
MTFEVNNQDEKDKITTQIKYLKGFLNSVDRKLSNKRFMDNAPDNVVNIEKNKRKDTIIKLKSLEIQFNSFD